MPENIGTVYNTQIPRLDENADVQTALRLYHYGEDTSEPTSLVDDSIAGHLANLESTKIDTVPVTIQVSEDLNDFVGSGYFFVTQDVDSNIAANAPSYTNNLGTATTFYRGIMKVVNSGEIVIQEYHMIGSQDTVIDRPHWRIKYLGTWTSWSRAYSRSDILEMGDSLYLRKSNGYTQDYINANFAPRKLLETQVPVGTTSYTLTAGDITKIVTMFSGGTLTIPGDAVNIPIGTIINVYNASATEFLTIAGAAGVTVRNPGEIEPYQEASLRKRAANEWVASGPVY